MKIGVRLCRCLIYIKAHTHTHALTHSRPGLYNTLCINMLFYYIFVINDAANSFYRSLHSPAPIDPVHVPTLYDPEDCLETRSISPLPHVDTILSINTLRPRQNSMSQTTYSNVFSSMKMFGFRFKFHWSPINSIPALIQIMAWRQLGDKPLFEPMMAKLPTHICITRPSAAESGA